MATPLSPTSPREGSAELRFLADLSAALLSHGLPMSRVEESIRRVSASLGLRATSFGVPTGLIVQVEQGERTLHRVVRGSIRGADLGRLSALHALVGQLEAGETDLPSAVAQLERELAEPPRPGPATFVLASALASGAAAGMLGGDWTTAELAFVLGAGVGLLHLVGHRWSRWEATVPLFSALAVAACVGGAQPLLRVAPEVATLASLIMPLPGLSLTIATTELAAGHFVSGASRLVSAIFTLFQLGAGVVVGRGWAGAVDATAPQLTPPQDLAVVAPFAAALAFALAFHVPRRDVPISLALSVGAALLSQAAGGAWGAEASALLGATVVGVASNLLARWRDRPASVYLLPPLVMLVPGSLGFLSLGAVIGGHPAAGIETAARMLLVAVCLSTGLVLAGAMAPAYREL